MKKLLMSWLLIFVWMPLFAQNFECKVLNAFRANEFVESQNGLNSPILHYPKDGNEYLVIVLEHNSSDGKSSQIDKKDVKLVNETDEFRFVGTVGLENYEFYKGARTIRIRDNKIEILAIVFLVPTGATVKQLKLGDKSFDILKVDSEMKLKKAIFSIEVGEVSFLSEVAKEDEYDRSNKDATTYREVIRPVHGKILRIAVKMTLKQFPEYDKDYKFMAKNFSLTNPEGLTVDCLGGSKENEIYRNHADYIREGHNSPASFNIFFNVGANLSADLKGFELCYAGKLYHTF